MADAGGVVYLLSSYQSGKERRDVPVGDDEVEKRRRGGGRVEAL